ncbi:MAG: ImmA/IrrE family metallo-endopeptidase [Oscillospiraceae bacterium]|nr:ImmA/IrrE family metallo-endopeptidase [Oscillospiraceae bacterium]
MEYQQYQKARDKVWELLLKHGCRELPIQVSQICKKEKITLLSYGRAAPVIAALGLEAHCENDGFTAVVETRPLIFYNERCTVQRQRFTVAHELGHLFLGHVSRGAFTIQNREPEPDDQPAEQEANVFAARLLAPACVLWGMHARSPEDIARLCDISRQSAAFRARRMELLYRREQVFLQRFHSSCFLRSSLERQVYEQFLDFIRAGAL